MFKDANRYVVKFIGLVKTVMKYGSVGFVRFFVNRDKKLSFLSVPKAANSSIKIAMFHLDCVDNQSVQHMVIPFVRHLKVNDDEMDYFCFSVVRNPFDHMVSCFCDKCLHLGTGVYNFDYYLFGYLRNIRDFRTFVSKVSHIPERLLDRHLTPQYNLLYDKKGKCRADFVCRYENLMEDLHPIMEKYDFDPLPHYNSSNNKKKRDWREFYTLETAEIVYRKYRKDFETFGYEDSYKELKEYLKEREKNEQ